MGGVRKEVIVDKSPFFGIVHQYLGLGTFFYMEAVCKVLLGPIFSSLLGEISPCSGYAVNFHALLKHVYHVAHLPIPTRISVICRKKPSLSLH